MAFLKHGMARTRLYRAWTNMRNRCNRPAEREYENYGGRRKNGDKCFDFFIHFGYLIFNYTDFNLQGRK